MRLLNLYEYIDWVEDDIERFDTEGQLVPLIKYNPIFYLFILIIADRTANDNATFKLFFDTIQEKIKTIQ